MLELSYSDFSCLDRRSIYLALDEIAGSNNPAVPSSEVLFWTYLRNWMGWEPSNSWRSRCCAVQSEFSLLTPRMKPTRLSIQTRLHHRVDHLPDTQITSDTTYLHALRVACGFFLSFLPRTKLIILAIERIVPPPQRLNTPWSSAATHFHPRRDTYRLLCHVWNLLKKFKNSKIQQLKRKILV